MHNLRLVITGVWLLSASVLAGCLTPATIEPSPNDPPALKAIRARYEAVVTAAREDPSTHWHSSWTGNIFVNTLGGRHRGLCYQWQDHVFRGVEPTVRRVGWDISGLASNRGHDREHHVVLVWDPRRVRRADILPDPPAQSVYVLDAWHEGRPLMHWLEVWLENEAPHHTPPELEELPVDYDDPSAPPPFADPLPPPAAPRP